MNESITDRIYSKLRDMILIGDFPPETTLSEQKVASQFGSSKTPAREAMALLCREGYLLRYPNCGYVVRKIDSDEYAEVERFRRTLERAAIGIIHEFKPDAELRAIREELLGEIDLTVDDNERNYRFHMRLVRLTRNRFFIEALDTAMASAARWMRFSKLKSYGETSAVEEYTNSHVAIVDALLAHDLQQALQALEHDYTLGKR
jgi:DNA-binding GntR family transcriptional regulator